MLELTPLEAGGLSSVRIIYTIAPPAKKGQ
jgi:hypothetical protein